MTHVASIVTLVDIETSSDTHTISAVAFWARASVVVFANWHTSGQWMALSWAVTSLVEDAVEGSEEIVAELVLVGLTVVGSLLALIDILAASVLVSSLVS